MTSEKVRFPIFAARIAKVCDELRECPPLHKGRQVWIRDRLAEHGHRVSIEGVRKWLAGETRPREETAAILGRVLGVDPFWLRSGPRVIDTTTGDDQAIAEPIIPSPLLQIALRPSLVVEVRGIPLDLTKAEASKLGKVLMALAEAD